MVAKKTNRGCGLNIIQIGAAAILIWLIATIAVTGYRVSQVAKAEMSLVTIRREWDDRYFEKIDDGTLVFPQQIPPKLQQYLACPPCDGSYVYNPTMPSGERIAYDGHGQTIVMWSPCTLYGERLVMFNNLMTARAQESDIDWAARTMTARDPEKNQPVKTNIEAK